MSALKTKKAAVFFILITAFLDVVALGIVVPVFPEIIESFTSSLENASFIYSSFIAVWALMQFIASPILGSLSDRYGRRPIILISTAGLAIDYVIIALAPDLWWLLIGRIFGGLTSASLGTAYAYLADITNQDNRAKAFGMISAAFSAGFVIGPMLGGTLGEMGLRLPFWLAAALNLVAFFYGLFILPESLPIKNRMAFSWHRANPLGAIRLLTRQKRLVMLAIIEFIANFCNYVFYTVFVLYVSHRFNFSSIHIGGLLAIIAILDIIIQIALVPLAVKRLHNEGAMILGLLVGALGTILIGLAPTPLLFTLCLIPLSMWGMAVPTSQALMSNCVSISEQGQLQGANMSIMAIAGIIAPLIFGSVYALFIGQWKYLNLSGAPFLLAGLLLIIGAIIGWRLPKKHNVITN